MGNHIMGPTNRVARWLLPVIAVLSLVAAGCTTSGSSSEDAELDIVVTTSIWADVVSNVVGDDADVETLVPVGADPHAYAPSSQQVASIQTADLVVANGLELEEGLLDVLDAAAEDGATILELGPELDPIPFSFAADHDHEDEDGHEGDDPHVWMDPDRVAAAALVIADALIDLDGSVDWVARAEAYAEEVRSAARDMDAALADVGQRKLVTNHEALGYFADRFDFEVVGVVIPGGSTLADPSSGELAELIEVMEAEGVRVIFGETSSSSALADAVAAELGDEVTVVELYTGSLGEPGSGAETVIGMLSTNAELIAASLRG